MAGNVTRKPLVLPQAIVDQVGRVVIARFEGRFVFSIDNGAGAVPFVEAQAGGILLSYKRVLAQVRVIGQALKEKPHRIQVKRFLPHPFVEGTADAAASPALSGGDIV